MFMEWSKWMGNVGLLSSPACWLGTEWLACYKNTDVSHCRIESTQEICPEIAGGFVIRGHRCPWPDDNWTQTDRYVPCLDLRRYLLSLYLDQKDEYAVDLQQGTRFCDTVWLIGYNVTKEQDTALLNGTKTACSNSMFRLEIFSIIIIFLCNLQHGLSRCIGVSQIRLQDLG